MTRSENQIIADLARAKAEFQRRTLLAILTQKPLDAEAQKHVEGR